MISNLQSGNYTVTVTDSNGCSINESYIIIEPDEIQFSTQLINSQCEMVQSGSIHIDNISGGTAPYSYSLNGTSYTNTNVFENLEAGTYSVYVQDTNACETSYDIILENEDNLEIIAPPSLTITQGDTLDLDIEFNFMPTYIEWIPDAGLSCANCSSLMVFPASNTSYQIIATDEFGCNVQTEIMVQVLIPEPEINIYLPTIFTPFSIDRSNSEFAPLFDNNSDIQVTSFKIFDRWGNMVFSETLNEKTWKGFINGEKAQQGVYVYLIEFKDGVTELIKTGQVLLIW